MNISINKFISFDIYMEYVKNYIELKNLKGSDKMSFKNQMEKEIYPFFTEYLKTLRSEGIIKPITNSKNRGNFFINAWDRFALKQEEEYDIKQIIDFVLNRLISMSAISFTLELESQEKEPTENDFRQEYEKFVSIATNGNFGMQKETINGYFFQLESLKCEKTDDYLSFEIENWNVTLYKFEKDTRKFVPAETPKELKIEHRTIEFKTGNLLIADWFRIQQFTDVLKNNEDKKSICSEIGRIEETDLLLKHNVIHISVGNTSPNIFKHDDKIVIGQQNYEEDDFATEEELEEYIDKISEPNGFNLGFVCTDLWWVTILEYETLLKILSELMTPREAKLISDKYLNESKNYTKVQIEPGKYHLYFCGDSEYDFDQKFNNEEVRKGNVKPYFVFSKNKIPYEE